MKKVMGLVLAVIMTMLLATGCMTKKYEYVVLEEALSDEQYGIGFRKADQALRDEVQKILVEMKKDGKLAEITEKWFGEDTSTVPDTFTPTGSTDDSLTKIKEKGELVLGLDSSFPPMGYKDSKGDIIGYDIDLATEVCKRMNVKLKLQPIVWAQNVTELNTGRIDCIWNGMTINDERDEKMNLSLSYMNNRQVVITLKDSGISKLTDLKDKTVVLQTGSTANDALNDRDDIKKIIKGGKATSVGNNILAMYELQKGRSDAVVMDEIVARYYIERPDELKTEAEKINSDAD
ncbi:MAG: transporter substrate-binding domain-containing protein [Oscillospiraceae bacterium]|nr:transporter substrate-binding domain-containing protein [Oscillospiraceae bacterium]MDD3832274.1 transporter substrate-binding domain-containing protein [Oscillospiraceae bacterium]MDD4546340.1 transporter substrate-binding domain-containing protein [Oscillospiraceae bacterium]